ncbi:MAG: enoyl-CoA hydratase/isomerase family protein [Bacteroidota bacterium]
MENNTVLFEKKGQVGVITLNRPDRYNAANTVLVKELLEVLDHVKDNDDIRAVVITGAGKGFCAGADMAEFGMVSPEEGRDYLINNYQPLMQKITTMPKPVIAAVNGTGAGVGASLALACDFRVMSERSGILFAFINVGLGPDGGGSWLLARQIGYSKALEYAIEGKKIDGETCSELGLCNKLVNNDRILSTAIDWATALAKRPTLAIGITKLDMQFALNNDLESTIAFEAHQQVAAFSSHDHKEGVAAFIQKRVPKYIGK